jgi:GT2 family glycosyltransferase
MQKSVSVVIPCWNSKKLLEKNLDSVIAASNNMKNKINEIIIVDDASSDDSVEFLKKNYKKKIRLFSLKQNRGFSGAVNIGVRHAKSSLVCLLNTDVIPSGDFLEAVLDHFDNNNLFAVSLHEKGYGGASANFENGFLEHKGLAEKDKAYRTFWVSGGSAVFKKSIWKSLHGFDEALFSPFYWEDIDICYRAQKRGYICMWEPGACVEHNHESVINESNFSKQYLQIIKERNQLLFIWKNITSKRLAQKHAIAVLKRILHHPGYIKVVRAASLKHKKLEKLRRREIRESSVSDESIFAAFKNI